MIGIIAAMKVEAEQICSRLTDKKVRSFSGMDFISGKL